MSQQGPQKIDALLEHFHATFGEEFSERILQWYASQTASQAGDPSVQILACFNNPALTKEEQQLKVHKLITWLNESQSDHFSLWNTPEHREMILQSLGNILSHCPLIKKVHLLSMQLVAGDDVYFNNIFQNTNVISFSLDCCDPKTSRNIAESLRNSSLKHVEFLSNDPALIIAFMEGLEGSNVEHLVIDFPCLSSDQFNIFIDKISTTGLKHIFAVGRSPAVLDPKTEAVEHTELTRRHTLVQEAVEKNKNRLDSFGAKCAQALDGILIDEVSKLMLQYVGSEKALLKSFEMTRPHHSSRIAQQKDLAHKIALLNNREFGNFLAKHAKENTLEGTLHKFGYVPLHNEEATKRLIHQFVIDVTAFLNDVVPLPAVDHRQALVNLAAAAAIPAAAIAVTPSFYGSGVAPIAPAVSATIPVAAIVCAPAVSPAVPAATTAEIAAWLKAKYDADDRWLAARATEIATANDDDSDEDEAEERIAKKHKKR
jgi:hypothetical protein